MCFRIVDGNLTIVSYKKFFSILTGSVALIGVTIAQCNNGVAFAQEKFVRPEAEKVCTKELKKYDSTLQIQLNKLRCDIKEVKKGNDTMSDQLKFVVQIMKMTNSKQIIKNAVKEVKNNGRIPVEEY